jgi:hypothetical protein
VLVEVVVVEVTVIPVVRYIVIRVAEVVDFVIVAIDDAAAKLARLRNARIAFRKFTSR